MAGEGPGVRAGRAGYFFIDMAEMKSEENRVLEPMIKSVAARDAHSGRGSGSMDERSHSTTSVINIPPPRVTRSPPSSKPLSRVKRR